MKLQMSDVISVPNRSCQCDCNLEESLRGYRRVNAGYSFSQPRLKAQSIGRWSPSNQMYTVCRFVNTRALYPQDTHFNTHSTCKYTANTRFQMSVTSGFQSSCSRNFTSTVKTVIFFQHIQQDCILFLVFISANGFTPHVAIIRLMKFGKHTPTFFVSPALNHLSLVLLTTFSKWTECVHLLSQHILGQSFIILVPCKLCFMVYSSCWTIPYYFCHINIFEVKLNIVALFTHSHYIWSAFANDWFPFGRFKFCLTRFYDGDIIYQKASQIKNISPSANSV